MWPVLISVKALYFASIISQLLVLPEDPGPVHQATQRAPVFNSRMRPRSSIKNIDCRYSLIP